MDGRHGATRRHSRVVHGSGSKGMAWYVTEQPRRGNAVTIMAKASHIMVRRRKSVGSQCSGIVSRVTSSKGRVVSSHAEQNSRGRIWINNTH